jgi:hypothetical protein
VHDYPGTLVNAYATGTGKAPWRLSAAPFTFPVLHHVIIIILVDKIVASRMH